LHVTFPVDRVSRQGDFAPIKSAVSSRILIAENAGRSRGLFAGWLEPARTC